MVRCEGENGMDKANDALKKSLGRGAIVDDLKKLAEVDEKSVMKISTMFNGEYHEHINIVKGNINDRKCVDNII